MPAVSHVARRRRTRPRRALGSAGAAGHGEARPPGAAPGAGDGAGARQPPRAARAQLQPAARHLRRSARRLRQGARCGTCSSPTARAPLPVPEHPRLVPARHRCSRSARWAPPGLQYRVFASRDREDRGLTIVAVPMQRSAADAQPPAARRGARDRGVLAAAGAVGAAWSCASGCARSTASRRTAGEIAAGELSRRVSPADVAHRGGTARPRAQRDARAPRAGVRRTRRQRGAPATLPRRRLARAAHAARVDPRLRRAVPHGRRRRRRRHRARDAAHRGRVEPHGRARRGSADARAARPPAASREQDAGGPRAARRRRASTTPARWHPTATITHVAPRTPAWSPATPTSCARCSPT